MPPQRPAVGSTTSSYSTARTALSALVLFLMLFSAVPSLTPRVSSDPGYVDNGDYTKSVIWNFTDSSSYLLTNTTVSGGLGTLTLVNETTIENTTAQYVLGTGTNIDLQEVPDSIMIDDSSLPIQTLLLQPGPEGKDNYLSAWWWPYPATDGTDLSLNCMWDPNDAYNKRYHIIMQFDLSSVPAGATIRNAELQMYEKGGRVEPLTYTIRAVNSSWDEINVSWSYRDATHTWDEQGGDHSMEIFSSGTVDGTNGWHSFDLTRLVDLWTRGTIPNYGFVIVADPEPDDRLKIFSDCEITNKPEQKPKLTVNYTLGQAVGVYESRALGPGTNSTFTLANWWDGAISKAMDEFYPGSISSRWEWTKDPTLEGGSVNFDRPGWFNITGSQSTDLTNASLGYNYLHQTISGNFSAETSLQDYFSADGMGAGLLIKSDDLTWLAIYKSGVEGSGLLVAKASNGGMISTLRSIPWATTTTFLRIDRSDGTYQLLTSMDGTTWSEVASYAPPYDFTQRLAAGLCVFSGGVPSSPIVEFDFFRIQPLGQSPTLEMRARTGNSTNLADPSWQPWGAPIGPSTGTDIGETGMYMQYQVTLSTNWEWLSPVFSGFTFHDERYLPDGIITTQNVCPVDLSVWQTMTVTQSTPSSSVEYLLSSNSGSTWQSLGTGTSFSLAITEPSMMVRMVLRTFDTLTTPTIDTIELLYAVSIASFQISALPTVTAGDDFFIIIQALDPSNNIATQWNGTVTLHALDATGTLDASGELNMTEAYVPLGGVLSLPNLSYDFAETIRISVTAGTVRGLSDPIVVEPGPVAALTMLPGNTTMFAYASQVFTATAYDALGNIIDDAIFAWTAEPMLGVLNSTQGSSVLLTVGEYYTGGYLNVSCSSMSVSRWIDVLPERFAPMFTSSLPNQIKTEDAGEWTLDISGNVSDIEDPLSKLSWYATNESIVGVHGENRTGNLVITFFTLPNVFGSADVKIVVVDSDGMKATTTLRVTIERVNDPPSFDPIDPLTVQGDVSYVYDFTNYVQDPDNPDNELNLSVNSANIPYTRVDGRFITFTYPKSMLGTTKTVIVTVRDPEGASSATALLIRVMDDQVPRQSKMLPSVELDQGTTLENCTYLPNYFYDPDDDVLSYDSICEHSIVEVTLDGYINVRAPDDWYGVEYATIRAIDPYGARAEGTMQITVRQVNHPAVIANVPDLKVRYDLRYEFDVGPYVHDPDEYHEEFTFTASDLHCSFTGTMMSVLYPFSMNNTVNPVTITVRDGTYTTSCVINITVSANYPPELLPGIPLPDHSFQEDNPTRYPMENGLEDYFWDRDVGDILHFIAFSLDSNVTATAADDGLGIWTVEFQTTADYYGTTGLVLRAIDSAGAIVERTVTLEVVPVPDPPELDLPTSFTVTEGQQVILGLGPYITDPDSSLENGDFTIDVQIILANGNAQDYMDGISALPGMLLFDYPVGFMKDHDKEFTIEVAVTDQTGKVDRDEIVIVLAKAPRDEVWDPLLMTAVVLAAIGGVSGMGAVAWVRRKKPFVIRDMMLVHNDGFLIGRYAAHSRVEGEIDQDIMSGMLTAVLNFVEDSMLTSHETLKTFGFKDYQVLVRRGTKSFAAVVHEGDLPKDIEKPIAEFLATFEKVYKKKIMNWTGDIETDFAGVELLIQSFVKEHSKRNSAKAGLLWTAKTQTGKGPAK